MERTASPRDYGGTMERRCLSLRPQRSDPPIPAGHRDGRTDQPLSDDWHVWDDRELVDLGALKGNLGSSNYEIPLSLDLGDFQTAVIWCRRFGVGFAVAPLASSPS